MPDDPAIKTTDPLPFLRDSDEPLCQAAADEIERLKRIEAAAVNVKDNCRGTLLNPTLGRDERVFVETVYAILAVALEPRT